MNTVPLWIVDNYLNPVVAQKISEEFPSPTWKGWHRYNNPIENKYATNDREAFGPETTKLIDHLCSPEGIAEIEAITGYSGLIADHTLHGAGYHMHGRGGNLNLHLDYSIHPSLGLERVLNILIYLSPWWHSSWGGALEIWNGDGEEPSILQCKIENNFNRAVIFDTTQESWHGMPQPLTCPVHSYRKSLALYYLQEPSESAVNSRKRAQFVPREGQGEEIARFCEERSKLV